MPVFVTEPGRPVGTRLPEIFRERQVGVIDELNETERTHESRNEPIDPNTEQAQMRRIARRAIREYGEPPSDEREEEAPYLPVSRMGSTQILSLASGEQLAEGLRQMEARSVHHLVITSGNVVAGLVDQRWILETAMHEEQGLGTAFETLTLPSFLTATPETDAHQLARLMLAHELDAALILDRTGQPIGLVTSTDYLRLYALSSQQEGNV